MGHRSTRNNVLDFLTVSNFGKIFFLDFENSKNMFLGVFSSWQGLNNREDENRKKSVGQLSTRNEELDFLTVYSGSGGFLHP